MRHAPQGIDVFSDVSGPSRALGRRSPALRRANAAIGRPTIRRREGGFHGLFRIIVEQQVSVPSAQAIWKRCLEALDCASPSAVKAVGTEGLKRLGLSSPKASYIIGLADSVESELLDFERIASLADEEAARALCTLKGVGPWTASIYLLFCEGRVDIWPPRDVALKHAFCAAAGKDIGQEELDIRSDEWAPWRGVAAHILWTYYAHLRGRVPI